MCIIFLKSKIFKAHLCNKLITLKLIKIETQTRAAVHFKSVSVYTRWHCQISSTDDNFTFALVTLTEMVSSLLILWPRRRCCCGTFAKKRAPVID